MTPPNKPFLTYYFSGYKFEFLVDEVQVTDIENLKVYAIRFTRDEAFPFEMQLLEILPYHTSRDLI